MSTAGSAPSALHGRGRAPAPNTLVASDAAHVRVDHEINPYPHAGAQPDPAAAVAEHAAIVQAHRGRTVDHLPSVPQCPDMAPLALVYRGKAARPAGCAESVAALLRSAPHGFDVRYVGPKEKLGLTPAVLAEAAVYAQPGGDGLASAYRRLRRHRRTIRDFVKSGGHYLGFCLGGYLAGRTPGFALLPGDTDQHIVGYDARVRHDGDTVLDVVWRGAARPVFFQDGPAFHLEPDARGVEVLARYPNGEIAALTAPFGRGAVGVVGPHPEAGPDWYHDAGLPVPPATTDLGHDLIEAVLTVAPGAADADDRSRRR